MDVCARMDFETTDFASLRFMEFPSVCGVASAYQERYRLAKLSIREGRVRLGFATGNRLGFSETSGLFIGSPP